jgi:CRISPR-associated protein Csd1
MNWIEALYRTFESNVHHVGDEKDAIPLAPVAHTVQSTHIVITLDRNGTLLQARAKSHITIIPCTEASAGRTSSPVAHPLADKLQYVASDFYELTGERRPKPSKEKTEKNHHQSYRDTLAAWADSPFGDEKISAVKKYLNGNDGKVLSDLCKLGVYSLDEDGRIPKKWKDPNILKPPIYELTKNSPAPWDTFVRWEVNIPDDPNNELHYDRFLWEKWTRYYESTPSAEGLCYVLGERRRLAVSHPKRIRSVADGAKLISANDGSGFTFRGRFNDKDGLQVCSVSFDVTQKAHNALRWLIARQGKRIGDQAAIVAWSLTGKSIPDALVSTPELFDEDEFLNSGLDLAHPSISSANTGQGVALALNKKLGGYLAELGDTAGIVVLSLDSATPGRMAISYYRELTASEFLKLIETWHNETAWFQDFGKDRKFIGAPSPLDIAQSAFGTPLDDKLKAATYRRLLPCIIENRPIPVDLVSSCIQRATNRQGLDDWEWRKALGIACALYRKKQIQTKQHHHTMSLERDRTTRSYLYGRLLAVADTLEEFALRSAGENRDTNAARFMQRFATHPYRTWPNIYLSLDPYRRRLKANAPGLLHTYESEIEEIKELFNAEDFIDDSPLEGEFLLAYHCQRTALFTKKKEDIDSQPA